MQLFVSLHWLHLCTAQSLWNSTIRTIKLYCFIQLKLTLFQELVHTWIANTYAGPTWDESPWMWVNYNISGFFVTPNGTVVMNTVWNEGGKEVGIYQNGKVVAGVEYTHGWAVR